MLTAPALGRGAVIGLAAVPLLGVTMPASVDTVGLTATASGWFGTLRLGGRSTLPTSRSACPEHRPRWPGKRCPPGEGPAGPAPHRRTRPVQGPPDHETGRTSGDGGGSRSAPITGRQGVGQSGHRKGRAGGRGLGPARPGGVAGGRQLQRRSVRESGNWRTRLPVAAKIALQIAGATGGNAGSPSPVVGYFVERKCVSIFAGASVMRISG